VNLEATSCRRMVCPLVQERSALTAIEESSRGSRVTLMAMDIKRRLEHCPRWGRHRSGNNSIQSKPAGPGSAPLDRRGRDFPFTFRDTFKARDLKASDEGRLNCTTVVWRSCFRAGAFKVLRSCNVRRGLGISKSSIETICPSTKIGEIGKFEKGSSVLFLCRKLPYHGMP
jgi:hypothetical protein